MDSPMTKPQVEVITSVQRRRRWSRTEKERIVAASMEPGAVASEVARAAGVHASQLFRWRQELCERTPVRPTFAAVGVATEGNRDCAPALPAPACGLVEVEFASGARLRISGAVDAEVVSAVMRSLAKSSRRR
jgi:transposase